MTRIISFNTMMWTSSVCSSDLFHLVCVDWWCFTYFGMHISQNVLLETWVNDRLYNTFTRPTSKLCHHRLFAMLSPVGKQNQSNVVSTSLHVDVTSTSITKCLFQRLWSVFIWRPKIKMIPLKCSLDALWRKWLVPAEQNGHHRLI